MKICELELPGKNEIIPVLAGDHRQYDYFVKEVCKHFKMNINKNFIYLSDLNRLGDVRNVSKKVLLYGTYYYQRWFNEILIAVEQNFKLPTIKMED